MTKKQLKAILFDFDGTILDTIPLIVESYQYIGRKELGIELSREEIVAGIGLPLEEVFAKLKPGRELELTQAYIRYNEAHLDQAAIYLGIVPMLEALTKLNIPLGIVTAKRESSLLPSLRAFKLDQYFSTLVTKFDTEKHKPDPAPLILGMEKLGLSDPSQVMYIGDAIFDVRAAKNGNFQSGLVAWSATPEEILLAEKPDYFFRQAADIVRLARDLTELD